MTKYAINARTKCAQQRKQNTTKPQAHNTKQKPTHTTQETTDTTSTKLTKKLR
jgi:hypothetical protein